MNKVLKMSEKIPTNKQIASVKLARFMVAIGDVNSLVPLIEYPENFWASRWGSMSWPDRCWLAQFIGLTSDFYLSANWTFLDGDAQTIIMNKTRQAARRAALQLLANDFSISGAA